MSEEVWIGLASVTPYEDNDAIGDAEGAYVTVLGLAASAQHFNILVIEALDQLGFAFIELEDVELLDDRLKHSSIAVELYSKFESIDEENRIRFGTFHSFPGDEKPPII